MSFHSISHERKRLIKKVIARETQIFFSVIVAGFVVGGIIALFDESTKPTAGITISLIAYPVYLTLRLAIWLLGRIFG